MNVRYIAVLLLAACSAYAAAPGEWRAYGRDAGGTRFAPLAQIDQRNVHTLEAVWTYRTGDLPANPERADGWVFECTPLVIADRMYVISPYQIAVCLDAATGDELWRFDTKFNPRREGGLLASRGLAYWSDGGDDERIIVPVRDGRIIALDARTGKPIAGFGDKGTVNLRTLLTPGWNRLAISSPPAVYEDLLITGFQQPDGPDEVPHAPVVALDARTGEVRWTFNTIPQGGEYGADTWADESWRNRGGGNVWSIMSVDSERGLVYLPTGAPNFDFYGGDRHGRNLFANALICLDAVTGERRWHFQTVYHDLWDYDLPAQPNLIDLTIDGEPIPAVALVGKTGFVYVFNRVTGDPVWPIEDRPVPASDVPGESAWPTQPFPTNPPPFSKQGLTRDGLSNLDEETRRYAESVFDRYRADGMFTPPSLEGSIVMPGYHGGGNWSGAAFDPRTGYYYVNSTELVCLAQLVERRRGRLPYTNTGWERLRDPNGYPLNAPPWGKLAAYDLAEARIAWERPLGEFEELTAKGVPVTGQENFGGATVTAGGLVFIGSTPDEYFRAFDSHTGEELWKIRLPHAAYAAPITYMVNGRQFVAICAGGGSKLQRADGTVAPRGDVVIAFALPEALNP